MAIELIELLDEISGFDALGPIEKIRLFGWYLHTQRGLELFATSDIRDCYNKLHLPLPNVAKYLTRLTESKDPKAIRKGQSYKLTREGRADFDKRFGQHQSVVQVSKLLNDLPGRVPDLAERNFLSEAIKCYRIGAFRACVVMTWNLAYSHLVHWILSDSGRLAQFNAAIPKRYPRKGSITVTSYDAFVEELKESEAIEVCGTASLLNQNVIRIMREKLGKRNTAAHPSTTTVVQSQADDVITDLVNNVLTPLT